MKMDMMILKKKILSEMNLIKMKFFNIIIIILLYFILYIIEFLYICINILIFKI